MFIYYRISDKGNPKEKLPYADKESCLKNAVAEFGAENIHVIADNCHNETLSFIHSLGLSCEETSLGNSSSFMYMIKKIIAVRNDCDFVYLLEDDYIHLSGSLNVLEEGLAIADYVTLYDHPDKYHLYDDNGNPFNNRQIHPTRIYVTQSSHWRETDSTTMTFACRVKTLKEDYHIWEKYTVARNPDDYHGFMNLTKNNFSDMFSMLKRKRKQDFLILFKNWVMHKKTRRLISAIPARATHAEVAFLSPVIDWKTVL